MAIILVTGPTRSGKSEWAERLAAQCAEKSGQQIVYVATAQPNANDPEWQARIAQHQLRRPSHWQVKEVPVALAAAIAQHNHTHCLLIDSLGTWLANLIEQTDDHWQMTQQTLIQALSQTTADVILVAEETGWGVVPAYELGRRFRDRLGTLSRQVGEVATDVYLVTSGYAICLTDIGASVGSAVEPTEKLPKKPPEPKIR